MAVSRRNLLVGSCLAGLGLAGFGGVTLVDHGILPGQGPLNRALGRCDVTGPTADASAPAGPVVRGGFDSARRRRQVNFTIGYPPGARPGDRLPVCLVLHGSGGDASSSRLYSPSLASASLASAGVPPFALAAMDGGDGYWHPHASDDPLGALLDEFLPLLASRGLVTDRADEFRGLRMRIDCGDHDSFAPAVRALRAKLPDPSVVRLAKGCHDDRFWEHVAPEQLRFIGEALGSTKRT